MRRKVIYVVVGRREPVNDRVQKLLELRDRYQRLTLLAIGDASRDRDRLLIKPLPNPTNALGWLRLVKLKKLLDRHLYFPSPVVLYVARCLPVLRKQITADLNHGCEVCLITCLPPHDVVRVGLTLKRQFPNLRWLIDWQDLWSFDENYLRRVPNWRRNKLLGMERAAFESADVNVLTNDYARDVLIQHYRVSSQKAVAIPHHFSRDDLIEPVTAAPYRGEGAGTAISIGFMGTLFKPPRVPGMEITAAIRRLRREGVDAKLHVYGNIHPSIQQSVTQLYADGTHMHGSLKHQEALRRVAQHDFMLLVLANLPNSRAVMSIKLPHYLLTGKPIIAIVPEPSAIASVIHETGAGVVIPSDSEWYERLRELLIDTRWPAEITRNEARIADFAWESVAQDWMNVIDGTGDKSSIRPLAEQREPTLPMSKRRAK